jgi:hypothetical protein
LMLKKRICDLQPFVEEKNALHLETDKTTGISTEKHRVTQAVVACRPTGVMCRYRACPCIEMPPPPLEDKV